MNPAIARDRIAVALGGTAVRSGLLVCALALAASACSSQGDATPPALDAGPGDSNHRDAGAHSVVAPKVIVVNMDILEAGPFTSGLGMTEKVPVRGLPSPSFVNCNADDVCEVLIGMGYANAASSIAALVHTKNLDLTRTYFIIAGIAGIDPQQGTVGSAAWSRYVVDIGLAHEIDAREMPSGWAYGYFGLGATSPSGAPTMTAGTELYQLNESLLQQAYRLSKDLKLTDDPQAKAYRAHYSSAPASEPPKVLLCDVTSSDTWFAGAALTQRTRDRTKLLTGGKGVACMSAQEDNATLTALHRGARAGRIDANRVAVLRTASDFCEPYPGQSDSQSLLTYLSQGGLGSSSANLYVAAKPLIDAIVQDWSHWKGGPPAP
jgi:purine nucleoside permease